MMLGGSLGIVEDVDCGSSRTWLGGFLRVWVHIDITKPFRRGIKLKLDAGREVWCPIQYERLLDFCYQCGLMRHSLCEYAIPVSPMFGSGQCPYGDWLWASTRKKVPP